MKLESALSDASDLKQQLELKAQENKSISASLEALRGTNAELEVCCFPLSLTWANLTNMDLHRPSEHSRSLLMGSKEAKVLWRA